MRLTVPDEDMNAQWSQWVSERPPVVRDIANRFNPWTLYVLQPTQQYVTLEAISEDGTVRITAWGRVDGFDVMYPRSVFGVDPAGMVPASDGITLPAALMAHRSRHD